jgi:hypothetical protein
MGLARRLLSAPPLLVIGFALLWSLHSGATGSPEQSFELILAKSNTITPPPYRAFRRLEGGLSNSEKRGWLEAWTEYQPGRGFTYEVVSEGGSAYVRDKILRGVLANEQKLIAAGKRVRTSLDGRNYVFEDGGLTDDGLQKIVLKPAKKSDGIINGSVLLEPGSGLLTKMQGRLVKSPSFWLRDVDVTWTFAHVNGVAVPVEMTSTGRVRMFGRSNLTMTYEYVSIAGQPASLKAALRDDRQQ